MRKIACVEPGIIVEGTLLKNGKISEKTRRDVTEECTIATMQHISCFDAFQKDGVAGYAWDKIDKSGEKIQLVLFDTGKYSLMPIDKGDS